MRSRPRVPSLRVLVTSARSSSTTNRIPFTASWRTRSPVWRLVLLIAERRNPTVRPEAEQLYVEGWPLLQTITARALKKAGRNGQCPCDSGRKVKDCHGAL
jgi:uncharacterized protein YchJ